MNNEARRTLEDLHGKVLAEAAQTYTFGVLDIDVPDDLQSLWEESFGDEGRRREAEAALALLDDRDRELLLSVAMQATAIDRPETKSLLADSIVQAGQSMFVAEIATLTVAAALLLREWHTKGRTKDVHKRTVIEPGRITIDEHTVEYKPSEGLAKALTKLGLGS